MSNDIFPGGAEVQWASLTETAGVDVSALTVEVAVIPTGTAPVDADWAVPLEVEHPTTDTVRASVLVVTDDLPAGAKFNVWIRASGAGEVVPRVAGQLKRARI